MSTAYLDHDFPETFTVWSWDRRDRTWWLERACHVDELDRLEDGAYAHRTIDSRLVLRIVSDRGGVLTVEDGEGRRRRALVLPDVGGVWEPQRG